MSGDGSAGERPMAWEGDPPGGHHRKGVLVFKPLDPMPATITLDVREVGGVADRTFTWNLASRQEFYWLVRPIRRRPNSKEK